MFKISHELTKIDSYARIEAIESLDKIIVAKNEVASFQVLLETRQRCVVNVSNEPAMTDALSLPRYRIEVVSDYKTDVYNVLTLNDDTGIEYADVITHKAFVTHEGNMPCSVWVDVHVEGRTSSAVCVNIYQSTATSDETRIFSGNLEVDVMDVEVPNSKDYSIYVDLWQHNSNLARYFEVPLWSDAHFDVIERVIKSLADVGQKSIMIIASECPWNGWGTHLMSKDGSIMYEHSMIQLERTQNGKFEANFKYMQRYIDLCMSYGIRGDISLYGLLGVWNLPLFPSRKIEDYPETIMVRYRDLNDGTYKYLSKKEEYIDYVTQIVHYFKKTNQFDLLRISADEPKSDVQAMARYDHALEILQEIEPNLKYKLAIDKDAVIDKYSDITTDFSTSFPCTTRYFDKLDKDKRRLWYVCNIPDKPNTFLKSPLNESRVLGVLNAVFNYDGFLRWAYTCWTANPRQDIRYATQGLPVGDICLVYPEKNGEIALSLRYKALKRGIEDYEIMSIFKRSNRMDIVKKAYEIISLNTNPHTYMKEAKITHDNLFSKNFADYDAMRLYLLNELAKNNL